MSLRELYTIRNIENSLGTYLAAQLLADGYLVYWHAVDALQTQDGWYSQFSVNQVATLADPQVAARVAAAKGLMTLARDFAFPPSVTRPTNEGRVAGQALIQVPAAAIRVEPDVALGLYEHGSTVQWRNRSVAISARLRSDGELDGMSDALSGWFDEEVSIPIVDHDGLSGEGPGQVRVVQRTVDRALEPGADERERYQLELWVRLEYIA